MKHEIWQFESDQSQLQYSEAIEEVILKLGQLENNNEIKCRIISLSFFIASNGKDFSDNREQIIARLKKAFPDPPAYSIIGQKPASSCKIQVDVNVITSYADEISVHYNCLDHNIACTTVETNSYIEYYLSGITITDPGYSIQNKIIGAFERMEKLLNDLNLGMGDIIRQWNYLEDIVIEEHTEQGSSQHYQILNDTRHHFYNKYIFSNGYPAATGIGMHTGGFIIDCILLKEKTDSYILPVKNPRQVSAYDYSQKVLIGSQSKQLTTPKFERAKLFRRSVGVYELLISGTAAILDEKSLGINNAMEQTRITLENINMLIESASQKIKDKGEKIKNVTLSYLRVYIKQKVDFPDVKSICDTYAGAVIPSYLIADICRDELLVEIEGYFNINTY